MTATGTWRRWALAGLLGWVAACSDAVPKVEAVSPTGPYEPTDEEAALLDLYRGGRLITARRKADALLLTLPTSINAHYVLGQVLREAEGQLPKAMKHLGRARELFEARYPALPLPEGPMAALHREILFSAAGVAGELEKFDYQLSLLDFYDSLYSPELIAEHAWPLMRLGKFAEARGFAEQAIASKLADTRSLGLNAMCAIEGEASSRTPRYEACVAAFEGAKIRAAADPPQAAPDERTPLAVHAYNAAQAAMGVLRPDEAEALAIAGTARLDFTPANPWRVLVGLYLDAARVDDAAYAVQEMLRWRQRQPPYLRDQDRAQTEVAQATFLLVIGRTGPGLSLVDRAIDRPDRRGLTSSTKEQATGAHALLRLALRRAHAQTIAEQHSWGGGAALQPATDNPAQRVIAPIEHAAQRVADRERIRNLLLDEARLLATFRPYVHGGLEPVPTWLAGDLVDVVGAGVARIMLERARDAEDDAMVQPYYDAVEAEIALAEGQPREATRLVELALDTLPQPEILLRARVAAVGAEAAAQDDDGPLELAYLSQVMQADPGTIRRRGLSLPVTIQPTASGAVAQGVLAGLADSPRLREGAGFGLTIAGADRVLSLCLSTPERAQLSCTEVDLREALTTPTTEDGPPAPAEADAVPLTDEQAIARVLQAFHARAFGFGLELSSIDLRSLDGRTVVSEEAARKRMESVLEQLSEVD